MGTSSSELGTYEREPSAPHFTLSTGGRVDEVPNIPPEAREPGVESLYPVLRFLHVMGFVFMSVPLFNLIVVNERAQLGSSFNYYADRYMENIIQRGASRCFTFQITVLVTGVLLLIAGPLGIGALWTDWVLLVKTLLLFTLMGLLSYVHLRLQPSIDGILAEARPDAPAPEDQDADSLRLGLTDS